MAKLVIVATHGYDDPTKAGLAFLFARGALESGNEAEVILAGDAAALARRAIAEQVLPVGMPRLVELMEFLVEHGVPVHT